MNQIRQFIENLIDRFQNLSDQDKKKVLGGLGGGAGLLVLLIIWGAFSSINFRHREIKRLEQELKQVDKLSTQYHQIQAEKTVRERQVRTNPVALFSLIQNVAGRLELQVSDLNERKEPLDNTDWVKVSVQVSLKKLSIDRLNAFLENIEAGSEAGLVKVTRLEIKTRFDDPQLLDAQMTISTWKVS